MADRGYLSIGEVLTLLKPEFDDLTISKIRFLESQGLLDPERTPSGYRKFYGPDVERLRWILRQQHENYLPLKVIKGKLGSETEPDEVLDAVAGEDRPRGQAVAATPAVVAASTSGAAGAGGAGAAGTTAAVGASDVARRSGRAPSRDNGPRRLSPRATEGPPAGVSLTLDELVVTSGLSPEHLAELVRFGLMAGKTVAGTVYYDEESLTVAHLAGAFMRYGVEARHLRMFRTSAEREAGFFEQVVMPMLKQRNPQARQQALDALADLSQLGQELHAVLLRRALRDSTGP